MDISLMLIGLAWVAIALMLLWGVAVAAYRLFIAAPDLPLLEMLERRGLNARQLEAAVGVGGMARALRRCALCAARRDCGRRPVECPNDALIRHLSRLARA